MLSRSRMVPAILVAFVAIGVAAQAADRPPAGDPVHGKEIYSTCLYCHAIDANRTGPMHRGLFGRRAGTVPGFDYSTAMKRAGAKGLIWTAATLDRFLANPQKLVPGTKMPFAGIADAKSRADLIAYLKMATAVPPQVTEP